MKSHISEDRIKCLSAFLDWAQSYANGRYDFRSKKKELLDRAKTAGTCVSAFDDLSPELQKELAYRWADFSQGWTDRITDKVTLNITFDESMTESDAKEFLDRFQQAAKSVTGKEVEIGFPPSDIPFWIEYACEFSAYLFLCVSVICIVWFKVSVSIHFVGICMLPFVAAFAVRGYRFIRKMGGYNND